MKTFFKTVIIKTITLTITFAVITSQITRAMNTQNDDDDVLTAVIDLRRRIPRETLLMHAARWGNLEMLWRELQHNRHPDYINQRNPYGDTALMLATKACHSECVMLLLRANANPLIPSKHGDFPLNFAAGHGNDLETVWAFINFYRPRQELLLYLVNLQDRYNKTPLMRAAQDGWHQTVQLLLAYGANPNFFFYNQNNEQTTALSLAYQNIYKNKHRKIRRGSAEDYQTTIALLERALTQQRAPYAPPAYAASAPAQAQAAPQQPVYFYYNTDNTPSLLSEPTATAYAPGNNHAGAALQQPPKRFLLAEAFALEPRTQANHTAAAASAGPQPHTLPANTPQANPNPSYGNSLALFHAYHNALSPGVNRLNQNSTDAALFRAVRSGYDRDIVPLLTAGANPFATDENGSLPFNFAAGLGMVEVLNAFIAYFQEHRPNELENLLNGKDRHDQTPLIRAAWNGWSPCIEILLQHRANPTILNHAGLTAFDFASNILKKWQQTRRRPQGIHGQIKHYQNIVALLQPYQPSQAAAAY